MERKLRSDLFLDIFLGEGGGITPEISDFLGIENSPNFEVVTFNSALFHSRMKFLKKSR